MDPPASDSLLQCFVGVVAAVAINVSSVRVLALSNNPSKTTNGFKDNKVRTHSLGTCHSRFLITHLQSLVFCVVFFRKHRMRQSHKKDFTLKKEKRNRREKGAIK